MTTGKIGRVYPIFGLVTKIDPVSGIGFNSTGITGYRSAETDEIVVSYIIHGGDPKECRRCQNSTRPPCLKCGHALSGNINTGLDNSTVCEYCGTSTKIEP